MGRFWTSAFRVALAGLAVLSFSPGEAKARPAPK